MALPPSYCSNQVFDQFLNSDKSARHFRLLDQDPISLLILLFLRRRSSKKPEKTSSFHIGLRWNSNRSYRRIDWQSRTLDLTSHFPDAAMTSFLISRRKALPSAECTCSSVRRLLASNFVYSSSPIVHSYLSKSGQTPGLRKIEVMEFEFNRLGTCGLVVDALSPSVGVTDADVRQPACRVLETALWLTCTRTAVPAVDTDARWPVADVKPTTAVTVRVARIAKTHVIR